MACLMGWCGGLCDPSQLTEVAPDLTTDALYRRVAAVLGLPAEGFELLAGVPPRLLERSPTQPLSLSHLVNCDTLTVHTQQAAAAPARQAPTLQEIAQEDDQDSRLAPTGEEHSLADTARLEALLIEAASAGRAGEVSRTLKGLRKAMANALREREEQRLATFRLQAALANSFTMAVVQVQTVMANRSELQVSFGVGGRKQHTESVASLGPTLLRLVVEAIAKDPDGRDNLQPLNLTHTSPRIFWNLVRYGGGTDDLESVLMDLCPGVDWAFLGERTRSLSEKALENERQATEAARARMRRAEASATQQQQRGARRRAVGRRRHRPRVHRRLPHDGVAAAVLRRRGPEGRRRRAREGRPRVERRRRRQRRPVRPRGLRRRHGRVVHDVAHIGSEPELDDPEGQRCEQERDHDELVGR
jgi:hypothetical protein